jgi:hypothetical protein
MTEESSVVAMAVTDPEGAACQDAIGNRKDAILTSA